MGKQFIVIEVGSLSSGVHSAMRYVRVPKDFGFIIEHVDVTCGAPTSAGDSVFNIRTGPDLATLSTIFAMPADRPKITAGQTDDELTDLDEAVAAGSYIVFDADSIPLGGLSGPIFFTVRVEDGTEAVALTWRGQWDSATAYNKNDLVKYFSPDSYNSTAWIAVADSTNVVPGTDPAKWAKMVEPESPKLSTSEIVSTLYTGALARDPSGTELNDGVAALEAARQSAVVFIAEMKAQGSGIFEGSEYVALATSDEQYVTDLYAALLGRVSEDEATFDAWVASVAADGRASVLSGFIDSEEFYEHRIARGFQYTIKGYDAASIFGIEITGTPAAGKTLVYVEGAGTDPDTIEWQTPAGGGGASLPTGGTAGQVLVKQSGTDGDADWANQIGVGITGGGFSGASGRISGGSLASGSTVKLDFSAGLDFDTDSYHSVVSGHSRFTVPASDWYVIHAWSSYQGGTTGVRYCTLYIDGAVHKWASADGSMGAGGDDLGVNVTSLVYLNAGQYVELEGYQDAGAGVRFSASLSIMRAASGGAGGETTYLQDVLAFSPEFHFRLHETTGTFADATPHATVGTLNGSGATRGVTGLLSGDTNKALQVAGAADVSIPHASRFQPAGAISLMMLFKPASSATRAPLITSNHTDYWSQGRGFHLEIDAAGKVHAIIDQGAAAFVHCVGSTVTQAGTTYHCAAVFDGETVKVYLDGILEGSVDFPHTIGWTNATDLRLLSNVQAGGGTQAFAAGVGDEATFIAAALTSEEVRALAVKALGEVEPPANIDLEEIDGFVPGYIDGSSFLVGRGVCYIPSERGVKRLDAPAAVGGLSLSASTWYYVYAYFASGRLQFEVSSTAPAFYGVNAAIKPGDNSRRYTGISLLTTSGGNISNFLAWSDAKHEVCYLWRELTNTGIWRILSSANPGNGTTSSLVDISAVVPAVVFNKFRFHANLNIGAGDVLNLGVHGDAAIPFSAWYQAEYSSRIDLRNGSASGTGQVPAFGEIHLFNGRQFVYVIGYVSSGSVTLDAKGFSVKR